MCSFAIAFEQNKMTTKRVLISFTTSFSTDCSW